MSADKLPLPKLALGAGVFAGVYDAFTEDTVLETIQTAFDKGINMIDTSPYYNDSEIIVGAALKKLQVKRSDYYISTKLGRYGYKKADFDYSKERVRSSVASSLERLNTDYLDFVCCHDVEFVDINHIINETLPELFKLKAEGAVKNVGISGYPLDVLLKIAELQNQKGQPLDHVLSYCHANLHNQQAVAMISKLKLQNVKYVFMASPLSMGLLRTENVHSWHPASPELISAVNTCKEIAHKYNTSLQDIALTASFIYAFNQALLSDPAPQDSSLTSADSYLVGMIGKDEVYTALASLDFATSVQRFRLSDSAQKTPDIVEFDKALAEIEHQLSPFKNYSWASPPDDA
ncbi:hypothetical protein BB561_001350 [Smittium simulii]|uniref:NADP-dependent oxidoreductase domain-containing protein n=1 Tax=Smittium simulii TaxID=133385 RepID=A0A2T9YV40_9FUNG|nr:hypothetical protein BB561_001350 [Smittium simulii]